MKPIQITALVSLAGSYIVSSQPSLTIYNADFAAVRDRVALDLKKEHLVCSSIDLNHNYYQ